MEITPENAEELFALELGYAFMGIIAGMERLGHVTLKGHLHYQHADQTDPGSIAGDVTHWFRMISAFGAAERDEIGKPQDLINLCVRIKNNHLSKALSQNN
jgi:hypothetical protein